MLLKILGRPYVGLPIALVGFILMNYGWTWFGGLLCFSYVITLLASLLSTNSLKNEATWGHMFKIAVFGGLIAVFVVPVMVQRSNKAKEEDRRISLKLDANDLCRFYLALPDNKKGQYDLGFCNIRADMGDTAWREQEASYLDRTGRHDDAERMRNGGEKIAAAAVDTKATTASTEAEPKASANGLWK